MIFQLDQASNKITRYEAIDFKSHHSLERQHIEKWIESYPAILGEELLVQQNMRG